MERGTWQATDPIIRITKSQTQLNNLHFHFLQFSGFCYTLCFLVILVDKIIKTLFFLLFTNRLYTIPISLYMISFSNVKYLFKKSFIIPSYFILVMCIFLLLIKVFDICMISLLYMLYNNQPKISGAFVQSINLFPSTDLGLAQVIPYVWTHEPVFGYGSHTQVLLALTRFIHMSGDQLAVC